MFLLYLKINIQAKVRNIGQSIMSIINRLNFSLVESCFQEYIFIKLENSFDNLTKTFLRIFKKDDLSIDDININIYIYIYTMKSNFKRKFNF